MEPIRLETTRGYSTREGVYLFFLNAFCGVFVGALASSITGSQPLAFAFAGLYGVAVVALLIRRRYEPRIIEANDRALMIKGRFLRFNFRFDRIESMELNHAGGLRINYSRSPIELHVPIYREFEPIIAHLRARSERNSEFTFRMHNKTGTFTSYL